MIGRPAASPEYQSALTQIRAHNPNDVLTVGVNWTVGLESELRRFVPYNGGLGTDQLAWMESELRAAARRGDRVVVLTHAILHPDACGGTTMCFDYVEALDIFSR